ARAAIDANALQVHAAILREPRAHLQSGAEGRMITNSESGTNVHEIADGIYRIHTPLPLVPGGFSFNQYLIDDDEPLLFHTGLRRMFPVVREAIASVLPVQKLRYVGFSHFESDECGALNLLLADAPRAVAVCSGVAAMVSVEDFSDRPP